MTVRELYAFFNEKIPPSLSCTWDNDGMMCCPDPDAPVSRVLVALDITQEVVKCAIDGGYDLILSHHPLIFSPLRALNHDDPIAKKLIALIRGGVAVFSFHTRLDAVEGGVNDLLAERLGLCNVTPFGADGEAIGRIGELPQSVTLTAFAEAVKQATGAPFVTISDATRPVRRVAVLGGSGSDDVIPAICAGADTYLSGELKHNWLTEAPERSVNLIAAGHFYTENLVCERLRELALTSDPTLTVDLIDSNPTTAI